MWVQVAIRHRYRTVLVEHLQGYFINFTTPIALFIIGACRYNSYRTTGIGLILFP
jgi:hypothetical protein